MRNLQETQAEILELVARGHALGEVATRLCQRVEEADRTVLCSVILVDEERRLRPLAAPSLPESFSRFVDGIVIGPKVGSAATRERGEEVSSRDIRQPDPLWRAISEPCPGLVSPAVLGRARCTARRGSGLGTLRPSTPRRSGGPRRKHRPSYERAASHVSPSRDRSTRCSSATYRADALERTGVTRPLDRTERPSRRTSPSCGDSAAPCPLVGALCSWTWTG